MIEHIVFMQVEDGIAKFERSNGDTYTCLASNVPEGYVEGDVIKALIPNKDSIVFLMRDVEEMNRRRAKLLAKKTSLRERARRSSSKKL